MSYKYDIFISYNRGFINRWLADHFLRFFEWHLQDGLGRSPRIFFDKDDVRSGDAWLLRLKDGLACSACIVPILSPSYFESEWCRRECYTMLQREKHLGYRTLQNPHKLVIPIAVSDGLYFPEFIKAIQYWDFRDYVLDSFEGTRLYTEFQQAIRQLAIDVADVVNHRPEWNDNWIDEVLIDVPEFEIPPVTVPVLG